MPLTEPHLSFRAKDCEARAGAGALQAQVGDYGLKFSRSLRAEGPWAQLGVA